MGYPQGEAWTFMNRHFCLHKSVSDRSECRIAPGKKLYAMFAQGAPDNPEYRAHNEELLQPFSGWGFERMEPLIRTAQDSETALKKAYQLGNLLCFLEMIFFDRGYKEDRETMKTMSIMRHSLAKVE